MTAVEEPVSKAMILAFLAGTASQEEDDRVIAAASENPALWKRLSPVDPSTWVLFLPMIGYLHLLSTGNAIVRWLKKWKADIDR